MTEGTTRKPITSRYPDLSDIFKNPPNKRSFDEIKKKEDISSEADNLPRKVDKDDSAEPDYYTMEESSTYDTEDDYEIPGTSKPLRELGTEIEEESDGPPPKEEWTESDPWSLIQSSLSPTFYTDNEYPTDVTTDWDEIHTIPESTVPPDSDETYRSEESSALNFDEIRHRKPRNPDWMSQLSEAKIEDDNKTLAYKPQKMEQS